MLLNLREFEVSIIARFLSARDKLLAMALLNHRWHYLIGKHYFWSRFPEPGPFSLLTDFICFFDSFSELTGIEIPYFNAYFLTINRAELLKSEASLLGLSITSVRHFELVREHKTLLSKLSEVTIQFSEGVD